MNSLKSESNLLLQARVWLALTLIGSTFPNYFFIQHYVNYGFNLSEFWQYAVANWISAGATTDLLFASFLMCVFIGFELYPSKKTHLALIFGALSLAMGLSCALPCYMYYRTRWQKSASEPVA